MQLVIYFLLEKSMEGWALVDKKNKSKTKRRKMKLYHKTSTTKCCQSKCMQCRDPSSWEHVARTSWWHVARITTRIHVTRLSYPDCLKEVQTTLISTIHPDGFHKYIWMTNISHPNIIVWVIDWSKQVLHVITIACHGPRSSICRVKGQDEVTTSHFPRSLHTITYHDLCQPPVGWW